MWRRRTTFARQVLVALDTAVSAGAFTIALAVRDWLSHLDRSDGALARWLVSALQPLGGLPPEINQLNYLWMLVGLIPLWAVALAQTGTGDFRMSIRQAARRHLRAVLLGLGLFILAAFLFKLEFLARTFVVLFGAFQLAALVLARVVVQKAVRVWRRRDKDGHRMVIVGSGENAVGFARNLIQKAPINVKLLGYVSIPGEEPVPEARPHLGDVDGLEALLDRLPVDEVVFAVPGKQPEAFQDALKACDDRGVDVLLTLPPQVPGQAKMEIANVSGFNMPMLGLRRTPTGELRLAVKRLMDIAGGAVGLLLAGPILIATAIAIRVDSKGPIFFRQVRAGRNGRKFTMYKFRSMIVDAEEKKAALMHLNEMGGPVFKIQRDPRITRVGRFIRKTSIDELPQFFNILKGDMSLVGPRPPLPSEVEQYEAWQRRRLSVKPGLTGLWQVSGRNQIDFEEWMQLDLEYIDNWSLWLDLRIILKTVPTVLFHKGAS